MDCQGHQESTVRGMDRSKTNAEHLHRLLNAMLPHVSRVIAKTNEDPGVAALARLLFIVWCRHQHAVAIDEMMETEGGQNGVEIELDDYADVEKGIADLARACG